jgi:hypothetical protein
MDDAKIRDFSLRVVAALVASVASLSARFSEGASRFPVSVDRPGALMLGFLS